LVWFTEAIIFNGDKTGTFTGNGSVKTKVGDNIVSTLYVKGFPFLPKSFIVDVEETEWADKEETEQKVGGGWWSSIVKDEKQLIDAFAYYKRNILE
jgi:hypothetical protein